MAKRFKAGGIRGISKTILRVKHNYPPINELNLSVFLGKAGFASHLLPGFSRGCVPCPVQYCRLRRHSTRSRAWAGPVHPRWRG